MRHEKLDTMTDDDISRLVKQVDQLAEDRIERNAEIEGLRARLAAAEKALRDALLLLGQASGSESMDRAKAILDEALHPDGAASLSGLPEAWEPDPCRCVAGRHTCGHPDGAA